MFDAGPYLSVVWMVLLNVVVYLLNENSVLKRYIKRRGRLLRCTNDMKTVDVRPSHFLCWDILDPDHTASAVVPISLLLVYRLVQLAVFCFTFICQKLWGSKFSNPPLAWLIYFSNWSFAGFGLVALMGSAVLVWKLRFHPATPLPEWTLLHQSSALVFQIVFSSAIFLTFFYWFVLYDGGTVFFDNFARHGLNVIMLGADLLMSRIPIVTYHFQLCLIYGSVYAAFLWLYYGASGDWAYTALNWHQGSGFVYYIAVPFLLLFSFAIMYMIASLRERFLVKKDVHRRTYSQLEAVSEVQMAGVAAGAV